jgi:hypothetical protein
MNTDPVSLLIDELYNSRRLAGPDWKQRASAARRLGDLHCTQAVRELAAIIRADQNLELSLACIQALGQIAGSESIAALNLVLAGTSQATVQNAARTALLSCSADLREEKKII